MCVLYWYRRNVLWTVFCLKLVIKYRRIREYFGLLRINCLLFLSRKTDINPQFQNRAIHMFTNNCGKRFLIQKFHTTFIQEAELKLRNVEVQLFIWIPILQRSMWSKLWMILDYQYIRMQYMLKQEYKVVERLTKKVRTDGI